MSFKCQEVNSMKKYLLYFVLLLSFVSSSCTKAFPSIENVEKTERTVEKEVLLDQVARQKPEDEEVILTDDIEDSSPYQSVPNEYQLILDDFYFLSEDDYSEEVLDRVLEEIGFVEYSHDEKLAYAVIDINRDGVPELLLGTIEGLKNSAPNSIFSLKDGKPILLASFWSRNYGVISADGIIYRVGSGGAANTYLSSFCLDKNADTLTQLTDIYSDFSDVEEKIYYSEVVDNTSNYITEESFWNFYEEYDNPSEKMKLID